MNRALPKLDFREAACTGPPPEKITMESVFDIKPTRRGPTTGNEKIHEFFAREGRPEAVPIRNWIEFWYSQLPPAKQPDIRGRLRSGDVHQFNTAYFELQMYAMLKSMGYAVAVEPSLAAGHYNPDFLARREDESFYLEATVCGQDAGPLRATRNEADAVEKLRSALGDPRVDMHSHLWLRSEGDLNHTLSKKEIARPFIDLLRRTTAAEVQESYESGIYHYRHLIQHREKFKCDDWTLEGVLHPKAPDAVGYVRGPARTAAGDASEAIRKGLAEKARDWKKWRPHGGILVVAMSVCHLQYVWNDGDETRAIAQSPTVSNPAEPWRHELRAIHAILFTDNVSLGNEQATRARLFPNPERDLPESLASLTSEHRLAKLTGFEQYGQGGPTTP